MPVIKAAREAVGTKAACDCRGSGAVDKDGSLAYQDAGADSCCYNLETWDPATFEAVCPGKAQSCGARARWLKGLTDAVDSLWLGQGCLGVCCGSGDATARAGHVGGRDVGEYPCEGAEFLLDRGIMPLYSPLWPVEGTAYAVTDGHLAGDLPAPLSMTSA